MLPKISDSKGVLAAPTCNQNQKLYLQSEIDKLKKKIVQIQNKHK